MRNDIFFFVLVLFLLSTTWNGVLLNFKNANKKQKKKYKNMQFLGRTEFGLSVKAVERHT